jgi:hypothetical protein
MPLRLLSFSQVPGALILYVLLGALALPNIAAAGFVFEVNDKRDLSDASPGDMLCNTIENTCTLRAAIEEINASTLPESNCSVFDFANHVILPPGTYKLATKSPSLDIGRDDRDVCVHIAGTGNNQGPAATEINGSATKDKEGTVDDLASFRIFSIHPRGRMSLDGVTITQGHIHTIGGGAILNKGDLAIYNSLLTKNSTHARGGAILNQRGNLWISQSTLSDNWARPNFPQDFNGDGKNDEVAGGAIANVGGSVLMYNVTVSGNLGGQDPAGTQSDEGGGGGGILNVAGGVIGMNNTTVTNNQTLRDNGGGIYNDDRSTATIWNTIVATNYYYKNEIDRQKKKPTLNDCKGIFGSFGYNLVGDESFGCTVNRGTGDRIGDSFSVDPVTGVERYQPPIDPLLGVLSENGGPMPTHALLNESPAIDAGNPDPAGFGACAETDQRYVARPQDGPERGFLDGVSLCDIGAYELWPSELSVGDVEITEGNSGRKEMVFEFRLSHPSDEPITVFYETTDRSANAGSDYDHAVGEVRLEPGSISAKIHVNIVGDRVKEDDEIFIFGITDTTGIVKTVDHYAVGIIKNDD